MGFLESHKWKNGNFKFIKNTSTEMIIKLFLVERRINNIFLKEWCSKFETNFKFKILTYLTFTLNLEYYKEYSIYEHINIFKSDYLLTIKKQEPTNRTLKLFDLFSNLNGLEDIISFFLNLENLRKKEFLEIYYGFKCTSLSWKTFLYVIYSLKTLRNVSIHDLPLYKKKFIDINISTMK